MSISDLIPTVKELPRAEKFQLLQFLVTEIGREEGHFLQPASVMTNPSTTYPIWTPYDVPEATVTALAGMLEQEENNG